MRPASERRRWGGEPMSWIHWPYQASYHLEIIDCIIKEIDVKNKTSRVVVPDDHLSLAIGKQGQNVRLAVQSCGWKIDIMPTSEAFEKGLIQILGL